MLLFIIQYVLMSLILIAIVHYIYVFFKNNLTEPKIKDLVNKPKAQYEKIYKMVSPAPTESSSSAMKEELQNYLQELSDDKPLGSNKNNLFDNNYQTL